MLHYLNADLSSQRERHLTPSHVVQLSKSGQIRTESRIFGSASRRQLTLPSCCELGSLRNDNGNDNVINHWFDWLNEEE